MPPSLNSWVLLFVAAATLGQSLRAETPCRIEVVEKGSGWPVPLVELRTTSHVSFYTDNAGVAAFDLPEFMNRETWLNVESHGYEVDKDGFGNRGVRFVPVPGGTKRIEVKRTNVAKRLGRLTGAGIFGESQKLGGYSNWVESGVVGQDTVELAAYRGKLFWGWGDTGIFSYELGLFRTTGATTSLQPLKSFEPPLELAFNYFRDAKGNVRNIIDMENAGPIWVGGYTVLPDRSGRDHLVCTYSKIKGPLEAVESGLAEWNDASTSWKLLKVIWKKEGSESPPFQPNSHSVFWTDANGRKWAYFGEGLPHLRCPATFEAWQDPSTWEAVNNPTSLVAADDGKNVDIQSGSIAWNAYRKSWVTIFTERWGSPSALGEVWYAEAPSPAGPWGPAIKVASHNNYTFYNPAIEPELAPENAKFILFEGTYSSQFADHAHPTPRYNYNQILYRLDLDDPALEPARNR